MRQSLIKFNNFCAARALPILWSRPTSSSSSTVSRFSRSSPLLVYLSFLLLYFSLSGCLSPFHRRVSAIYFPTVVSSSRYKLAPLAAEPLSTADLWRRHARPAETTPIYSRLHFQRHARSSIRIFPLFIFFYFFARRFVNFVDNVDRIFTTNGTFPKLLVDMIVLVQTTYLDKFYLVIPLLDYITLIVATSNFNATSIIIIGTMILQKYYPIITMDNPQ